MKSLFLRNCFALLCTMMFAVALAACESNSAKSDAAAPENSASSGHAAIRVKAGIDEPLTDSKGTKWAADTGFDEGTEVDRPDLQITGTPTPEIYHSERYSMNSYSFKVPNGKYLVKLHFSEDYEGISGPEDRLFTYAVKDGTAASGKVIKEVKNFSPWKASGAQFKAYVDSIPVDVTSGQITITFTPQVENPQINALEIIPQ
jgi:hypothetical protein